MGPQFPGSQRGQYPNQPPLRPLLRPHGLRVVGVACELGEEVTTVAVGLDLIREPFQQVLEPGNDRMETPEFYTHRAD